MGNIFLSENTKKWIVIEKEKLFIILKQQLNILITDKVKVKRKKSMLKH